MDGGKLRVRLAAPAREGKANRALLAFLARCLDVPPSRVCIASGAGSRHKLIDVEGLTLEDALRRLLPQD